MSDPDLFNYIPPPSEQQRQIERVTSRIGSTVLTFCRDRGAGSTFHAQELRDYVGAHGVAPASPDRVLRDLRKRGFINYVVVSRTKSLYRVISVQQQGDQNGED